MTKGKGKCIQWLLERRDWPKDECLVWPFSTTNGYGMLGYYGRVFYAHRMMCELTRGPAPSPNHEASHSCGNGHKGCVSPHHIRWKTKSDNQRDRAKHGTKSRGWRGKLTMAQADKIRALRGKKPQREIAEMFGVSRANVSLIQNNKAWLPDKFKGDPKKRRRFFEARR